MRRVVAVLAVVVCLAASAHPQTAYERVVREYLTGNADSAVETVVGLSTSEILDNIGFAGVLNSRRLLTAAAALHTEAAFRGGLAGSIDVGQLSLAAAFVEIGEKAALVAAGNGHAAKSLDSNSTVVFGGTRPLLESVSGDFRLLWYELVISRLQYAARLDADRYVKHALLLFPHSADVQLLAGIGQEMRCAPRVVDTNACRRGTLSAAEAYYRAALASQPDRLEARLRLGRVLQQLDQLTDARTMLAPLRASSDDRVAYLGELFLGGVEDALQHPEAALAAYDAAAARLPAAQTARLAASEVRYRQGERRAAADAIPPATGEGNALEPWWTYTFGEYWRIDLLLEAIHRARNG